VERKVGDPCRFADFLVSEELGFDSLWANERHFDPYSGIILSPPVMLAALAQRTKRVRPGTSIVVRPLHNPIEIAEQMAIMDVMSEWLGRARRRPGFVMSSAGPPHRPHRVRAPGRSARLSASCPDRRRRPPGRPRPDAHRPGLNRILDTLELAEKPLLATARRGRRAGPKGRAIAKSITFEPQVYEALVQRADGNVSRLVNELLAEALDLEDRRDNIDQMAKLMGVEIDPRAVANAARWLDEIFRRVDARRAAKVDRTAARD